MEPDQPPADTSDDKKPPSPSNHHHQQQQSTTITHTLIRSYECTFCKRGFTNAQALGGHMNIHRKDKNKLKHSSSTATTPPHTRAEPPSPTRSQLSPTTTSTSPANPFSFSHHGTRFSASPQHEKINPLPLFDQGETAVLRNMDNPPLEDGDVDLELRLGHVEPPLDTLSDNNTITTRKFF